MRVNTFSLALAAIGTLAIGSAAASAAPRAAAAGTAIEYDKASPMLMKRQAVQGVHADAMAILSALEREPGLAEQLAKNPTEAEAMLRARGATRAEHITVTPNNDETGQRITITITIVIRDVTIKIVIKI